MNIVTAISEALAWLNEYLWGPPMLVLLFGTHIYLTIRLGFIQRLIPTAIRLSVGKAKEGEGDVSQFGALTTALAATMGTGNIVGVAAAVAVGGPGAVLWCWLTGVFGIATKYAEAVLAVKYRVKAKDGSMLGGPMFALEKGLNARWAGMIFAVFTAIAAFGIGNMVQANAVSGMTTKLVEGYVAPEMRIYVPWVVGGVLATLTAAVILGGIKSIAGICQRLVPLMAGFYIVGCIIILAMNLSDIPSSLALILKSAFTGQAAAGGFAGATVMMAARMGIARGLFSNESGLGSAPIVAAAAQTRNPVRQGLVSASGTFWDTVVVCAITGLVLVNTGSWQSGNEGAAMTHLAFNHIPYIGPPVLTVGLLTFVFSTIRAGVTMARRLWSICSGCGLLFLTV